MRQIETVVHTALASDFDASIKLPSNSLRRNPLKAIMARWLNRGLPAERMIELRIAWPLWLIPVVLVNQLFAPHPVWVVFVVSLCGLYVASYLWVRRQAPAIELTRRRIGTILVAGDLLQEEFELRNSSLLPLLWAEFIDYSSVPDYKVGRIVACEGDNLYRWRSEVLCRQRGMFRLGPHLLQMHDPLGLFAISIANRKEEIVVIYPRVVHLPPMILPRGNSQGGERQRRPILGSLPAATISDYRPGDSLRHVHWASTARRGRMMVKDLEIEPSGNIWLVLDLDGSVQHGEGLNSSLEQGIVVAASLAADLLSGRDQRAVGLLAFGGEGTNEGQGGLVQVLPGMGSGHLWPMLSALAPVEAGNLSLATLLASSRDRIGRRSTLTVITPLPTTVVTTEADEERNASLKWVAELLHLKGLGVNSSVVLITPANGELHDGEGTRALLASMDIPCSFVTAGATFTSLLTFRRRRRIVRTTPTGGAVSYEVDEEVG